jgi:hypothetical protein
MQDENDKIPGLFDAKRGIKMTIIKPAFTRTTLEGEKRPDTFTVRVNKEERAELEQYKKVLNMPFDSKILKFLARIGFKVLLANFGEDGLRYILSPERRKMDEV